MQFYGRVHVCLCLTARDDGVHVSLQQKKKKKKSDLTTAKLHISTSHYADLPVRPKMIHVTRKSIYIGTKHHFVSSMFYNENKNA